MRRLVVMGLLEFLAVAVFVAYLGGGLTLVALVLVWRAVFS